MTATKTYRRKAMSNLSKDIHDQVIHSMQKGECKTYTVAEYGALDIYLIRDLFVESDHLNGYIQVIEDKFLVSITIMRL